MTHPEQGGRQPTVAVSLKMYFDRDRSVQYVRDVAALLAADEAALSGVRTAILPDFLVLTEAADLLRNSSTLLGAQDLCEEDRGAYTGEVSPVDLASLGVRVAEIGHAERRTRYHEDDAQVAAKVRSAARNGIIPLLCVGEPERVDPSTAADLCVQQIRSAVSGCADIPELWIGYEPYWAIGAAEPAPVEHVSAVCSHVREQLSELAGLTILYGGSAGIGLLNRLDPSIDGLFLGRFAHDPKAFVQVAHEAAERSSV